MPYLLPYALLLQRSPLHSVGRGPDNDGKTLAGAVDESKPLCAEGTDCLDLLSILPILIPILIFVIVDCSYFSLIHYDHYSYFYYYCYYCWYNHHYC